MTPSQIASSPVGEWFQVIPLSGRGRELVDMHGDWWRFVSEFDQAGEIEATDGFRRSMAFVNDEHFAVRDAQQRDTRKS